MATWRNWRGPVGWILNVAALAELVRAVLAVLHAVDVAHVPIATELASADADPLRIGVVALLVAAGIGCLVAPSTSADRAASRLATALVAVAALGDLTRLVIVLAGRPSTVVLSPAVAGLVARVLVEAAAVVALIRAARTPAASPVGTRAAGPEVPQTAPADSAEQAVPPVPVPAVWNPDPTAGTVWRRAGDAATGAAGIAPPAPQDGRRRAPDWRPARASEEADDPRDEPSGGPW